MGHFSVCNDTSSLLDETNNLIGLCKIRIATMSLRIAWARYPNNISLGIAANVFVYVGSIILLIINWFFVQRVVRAQHQRFGWSTPYRVFHRIALAILVITLLMSIVANVWRSFTINDEKLHVFRILILINQTYFTVFVLAPAVIIAISLLVPRDGTEKFGAGRLRNNISILLLAVAVVSTGQIFRCIINWIPQTPIRDADGSPIEPPWYLGKACFYCFNFATEIIVIIMYALVRVDLRFHIPNGSRMSGDYSNGNSRISLNKTLSEKNMAASGPVVRTSHRNGSNETIHRYNSSIFEDTNTLADSLRYESSTLELDERTGNWKVKRVSISSVTSRSSFRSSNASSAFHDRSVRFDDEVDVPPVPDIPDGIDRPLPEDRPTRNTLPVAEQSSPPSTGDAPRPEFEIPDHDFNGVDIGDSVTDALTKLEQNTEKNSSSEAPLMTIKSIPPSPPVQTPKYNEIARISLGAKAPLVGDDAKPPVNNSPIPQKRATYPPKSALKTALTNSANNAARKSAKIVEESESSQGPSVVVTAPTVGPGVVVPERRSSLEIFSMHQRPTVNGRSMSLQGGSSSKSKNVS